MVEGHTDLLSLAVRDRTQRIGPKLCQGRFRLDITKRFCTQRVVRQWDRLPRDMVTAPV